MIMTKSQVNEKEREKNAETSTMNRDAYNSIYVAIQLEP